MRNLFLGFFLALVAIPAAQAQDARQDFKLVNQTGFTISELYVSPSKTDNWEEDVLGDDELENGKSTTIRFNKNTRTCAYDLKIVYSDDEDDAIWNNIDLCRVSTVTLYYDRSTKKTRATFD
jgi:hypothetical protein